MNTVGFNQYLSDHVYENLVKKDDFFRKLNELVDWYELSFDLKKLGQNDHGGRPRYSPVLMFKMLFLSFLYDISDRETEDICNNHIRCKYFIGLEITAPAPDYSSLSVLRQEIIDKLGADWITVVFRKIIAAALQADIQFGKIQSIDSTHTLANVDIHKDKERQANGEEPRDPDAAWGCKGIETKLTVAGEKVAVKKYFYGYKSHLLAETDHGLITALAVSPGNEADVEGGDRLLNQKLTRAEQSRIGWVTGDKAYGCAVLISLLEKDKGIKTAFGLNSGFLKGVYAERWRQYLADEERTAARKLRYVVERVNADLKNHHSLKKCRYLGLAKYHFQATMAALAFNLKRMTTLLTGARFKPI